MKGAQNSSGIVVEASLPQKPLFRVPKEYRLALALRCGWVQPVDDAPLTGFTVETHSGLPLHFRIRDWFLTTVTWLGWGLLLVKAAHDSLPESFQSISPAYWHSSMFQEIRFGFFVSNMLILVLALFGTYTFYRFRNPGKGISEPKPLRLEELAKSSDIDTAILQEWHMARSLTIDINDQGEMVDYKIFPPEST